MIYIYGTWTQKYLNILLDSDWFYYMLELDLKTTQTSLLDLDWLYDTLDLVLKIFGLTY